MSYCNVCNLRLDPNDANHIDGKCPYSVTCSVTCSETHTYTYYCFVCKETNVNHSTKKCPYKCTLCTGNHTTEMHHNICEKKCSKRFGRKNFSRMVKC